jgi:hypothetical protein
MTNKYEEQVAALQNQLAQQPSTQQIQPQPTPTSVEFAHGETPEGKVVAVTFHTLVGQIVFFYTPEDAISIGEAFKSAGTQAKSPLVVPSAGGLIVPG